MKGQKPLHKIYYLELLFRYFYQYRDARKYNSSLFWSAECKSGYFDPRLTYSGLEKYSNFVISGQAKSIFYMYRSKLKFPLIYQFNTALEFRSLKTQLKILSLLRRCKIPEMG